MEQNEFIKELMKMSRDDITQFIKEKGKQPKIVNMVGYIKDDTTKRAFGYIK